MKISLVRHGQSRANINDWDYSISGDHKIPLTELGNFQAQKAGEKLISALRNDRTLIYCSPYERTRQTLAGMLESVKTGDNFKPRVFEDARLRETEHGYSDYEEQQSLRDIHGWFYYRWKGGESPADCYDRTSNFLDSMMRQVDRKQPEQVVIVTHGLTIRCFVMRFMHLSVEEFEMLANPDNCDIITIDLKDRIKNPMFTSGRWSVEGLKFR